MTKITKAVINVLGGLIPLIIFGIWILGAFHGSKKHQVDPLSASGSISSFYYGLEMFWHKADYEKMNEYIRAITHFAMSEPEYDQGIESVDFALYRDKLQKKIKSFTKEELEYIKLGTNHYLNSLSAIKLDLKNQVDKGISRDDKLNLSKSTQESIDKGDMYGLVYGLNSLVSWINIILASEDYAQVIDLVRIDTYSDKKQVEKTLTSIIK